MVITSILVIVPFAAWCVDIIINGINIFITNTYLHVERFLGKIKSYMMSTYHSTHNSNNNAGNKAVAGGGNNHNNPCSSSKGGDCLVAGDGYGEDNNYFKKYIKDGVNVNYIDL